jgi:hypothetical protein
MPKVDYSKCVIYKIQHRWKDELLYIGSTTNFAKRKVQHKSQCYNTNNRLYNAKLYQSIRDNGGWEEFNMVVIKEFPCENRRQAEAEEDRCIREMKSYLNMLRAYVSKEERQQYQKEYDKEYREQNRDKLKDKKKEYYEQNKQEISEKRKMYREANKQEISEKKKMYREVNKQKIKEKKKRDYQNNKEKINEKNRIYRQENKDKLYEKFNCACGGKYTHEARTKHLKTNKHQTFINQQTEQ